MGSVTSKPKPVVTATPTIIASTTNDNPATATEADPQVIAAGRIENILRRTRSTLGNIVTGFRGILSTNSTTPKRKSLLGE